MDKFNLKKTPSDAREHPLQPTPTNRNLDEICYDLNSYNVDEVEENLLYEASLIDSDLDNPLFLIVMLKNTQTEEIKAEFVRFSPENLKFLMNCVRDPFNTWTYYRDEGVSVESDVAYDIYDGDSYKNPGDQLITSYNIPFKIGLYYNVSEEAQRSIEGRLPRLSQFVPSRFNGRFMPYVFDFAKFHTLKEPKLLLDWWEEVDKHRENYTWLEEEMQIPWFSSSNGLSESGIDEEDEKIIRNDIYKVPCILYALKGQITEEEYKELESKQFITGFGVKTQKVGEFLNQKGYQFRRFSIKTEENGFKVNCHKTPEKFTGNKVVDVVFWESHWMRPKKVKYGVKEVDFVRVLEYTKRAGLLRKLNAFEYGQTFDNYSVDAMIEFDDKQFIREMESGKPLPPGNFEYPEKLERTYCNKIYFADFEATTNEEYHRPFLLCVMGFDVKFENNKVVYEKTEELVYWGQNCAKEFLNYLVNQHGQARKSKLQTVCRIYFHNLKYDFSFVLPHLNTVKEITKGGHLYSAKGIYKQFRKFVKLDFWDSLPIFQCSLDRAVRDLLTEKERKKLNIQKEVFPYNFYTYEMFNKYPNLIAPAEETKPFFKNEEQYQEFLQNIKGESSFNYKDYAIFYCLQDVRCLWKIVEKFSNLLLGTGVEGVYGTPPFSLNLLCFRTASSIGYEHFLNKVVFKKKTNKARFPFAKGMARNIIQNTIRGGRTMARNNEKWYYRAVPNRPETLIQDNDAVSLYPSAMKQLWVTEGEPEFVKGAYTEQDFKRIFAPPEATPEEAEQFEGKDGCIHVTWINTKRKLNFPLLCIKDPKTKLNHYKNFCEEEADTWVNTIDLFNLIEFQEAEFKWDAGLIWKGKRRYEIRDCIQELFDFRLKNHGTYADKEGEKPYKHEHPIQIIAKLMMNSIYGKSILKVSNKEKKIVDEFTFRFNKETGTWDTYDNWGEFYKQNAYRIYSMERIPGNKVEVQLYHRDTSSTLNIFGSDVLAMARRIIGRVMALAEEMEQEHPECSPGLFYTDTDSMQIRADLLKYTEEAFLKRYGRPICGETMGTFHVDFDPIKYEAYDPEEKKMVTKLDKTIGAEELWVIMKKMYAARLVGELGHKGEHKRMKGIPSDLIKYEHYEKLYMGQEVTYDLLNGHVSFFYRAHRVGSRVSMTRTLMNSEARAAKNLKRKREESEEDDTVDLPSEQEWEDFDEESIVDIE